MSRFEPTSFNPPPPNSPHLNLELNLANYLLVRSFSKNWLLNGLVHIPIPHHTPTYIAGEHYFNYHVPDHPHPIIFIPLLLPLVLTISSPVISAPLHPCLQASPFPTPTPPSLNTFLIQ